MKTLISTVQRVVVILSFAAIGMMQNPAVDGYASHDNRTTTSEADPKLELISRLDMRAEAVAIQSDYAYVCAANKLSIIDIRDKTTPFVVGEIEKLPGEFINDVEVMGDYIYIANGDGGLRIYNVSDPQSPFEAGFVANSEYFNDVLLSGDYAYVATDRGAPSGTLIIIDIKDPSAPSVIGSVVDTWGRLYKLAISGNYVYACSDLPHFGWLVVFDVTNPSSPSLVGRSDNLPGQIVDIGVVDNYAYATIVGTCMGYDCEGEGLYILDISNSSLPYIVNSYDMFPWRIETIENTAFVLGKGGLHVLDISDQTSPVEVDTYDLGNYVRNDFALDEPYLYVANEDGGFLILLFGAPPQSSNSGRIAYVGSDNNIWTIQENDSPEQITLEGNYSEPSWSPDGTQIAFVQTFTADNGKEAYQIGIVDPANFTEKVVVEPEKTPFALLDEYYRYWSVRWSPDGKSLLYIASDGRVQGDWVHKFHLETSQPDSQFVGFFSRGFDVSLADGAIVSKDFTNMEPLGDGLYLYSAQGGNTGQVILPVGKGGVYYQPQWSPDGAIIGYINRDRQSDEYSLVSIEPDGNQQNTLYTHRNGSIENFSWSPDGNKVVIEAEGSLKIIDLGTQNSDELVSGTQPDWSGHFSPDVDIDPIPTETPPPQPATGGIIAFVGQDRNIWLINPGDDNPSQLTTDAYISDNRGEIGVSYQNIKWSPDGKLLGATRISPDGRSILAFQIDNQSVHILISNEIGDGNYDWLPDSKRIIFSNEPLDSSRPGELVLLNIDTYELSPFLEPLTGDSLIDPDWADRGNFVSFGVSPYPLGEGIFAVPIGIAQEPTEGYIKVANNHSCEWRPTGDQLICNAGIGEPGIKRRLVVYSTSGENLGYLPENTGDDSVANPHWSPDGNYLAYSRGGTASSWLEILQVSGLSSTPVFISDQRYYPLDWSPDSNRLLISTPERNMLILDVLSGDITPLSMSAFLSPFFGDAVWRPNSLHPAPVTDLEVHPGKEAGLVILKCSNPDLSDPAFSTAKEYEFRYSKEPITEENWDAAEMTGAAPAPDDMTYLEGWTVPRQFDLNTRWYFAVKTVDENGNKSEISNVPWIIDTGFRPQLDGFSFCNGPTNRNCDPGWMEYPSPPADNDYTLNDMRLMFGDSSVCRIIGENNQCVPFLVAERWNINANEAMAGGHCYGMNIAAQILAPGTHYDGKDKPELFALNTQADQTNNLNIFQSRRPISYLFMYQFTNPIRGYMDNIQTRSVGDILDQLQLSMTNQPLNPVMLFMERGNEGHALSPFAVERQSNGVTWIWVYDSNWPSEVNRIMQINPTAIWWTYNVGDEINVNYWGSSNDFNLGLIPIELHAEKAEPVWTIFDHDDIWLAGVAHLLITNQQGQQTGYSNGQFINNIPDTTFHPVIRYQETGVESTIYTVPHMGTYTITLAGDEVTGFASITRYGANTAASIDNIPINPNTLDTLIMSPASTQIKYTVSETKSLTFTLALDGEQASYEAQIRGADIGIRETLSVKANLVQGSLIYNNAEAGDGKYDFSLTRIDQSGEEQVTYPDIAIAAHETHTFDFSSGNLDKIVLKIDQNSDGEYEIERNLGMQSRAENPTSAPPAEPPQETTIPVIVLVGLGLVAVGILALGIGALGLILYRKN